MQQHKKLSNIDLKRPDIVAYKAIKKSPIVVILDNVRSLNNVGAFFRTSDAFAVKSLILCGITAQPPHREINKTALGATESVDWEHYESTQAAVQQLKSEGYSLVAIEQTEYSTALQNFEMQDNERIAVVFGHEVNGVSQEVIDLCDEVIEIPQFGTKHSLNVSVSAGVILWELCKGKLQNH
tara:strand:+ start:1942 stop:2487 length:546 start_codon:yes stop_codon:yes gene_type:complete